MVAEPAELKVDPRFITGKLGDDFVLYDGLLDLAHRKGLRSIRCTIIQLPLDTNGFYAVCEATVELESGATFTDIGDANPSNTNKMVGLHILRMASTRAKARALRDAVNVGMVAVEELADDDQPARRQPAAPRPPQATRAPQPQPRPITQAHAEATTGVAPARIEDDPFAGLDGGTAELEWPRVEDVSTVHRGVQSQSSGPPATPKQLATIAKMTRRPAPEGLTLPAASALISELLSNKQGGLQG